jgi:hypothetical protein
MIKPLAGCFAASERVACMDEPTAIIVPQSGLVNPHVNRFRLPPGNAKEKPRVLLGGLGVAGGLFRRFKEFDPSGC